MVPLLHVPFNRELLINNLKNEGDKDLSFAEVCLLQRRGGEEKYLYSCIRLEIESIEEKKNQLKVGENY